MVLGEQNYLIWLGLSQNDNNDNVLQLSSDDLLLRPEIIM